MKLGIEWLTERSSEWELDIEGSGRRRFLDLPPDQGQGNCGKTLCFEDVGKRTDRTRTKRSDRREQDRIDTVLA